MAKIKLEKMSLAELKSLGKDIRKAIANAEKKKRALALKAATDAAAEHGFSLAELIGAPKKIATAKAPAKYAHPENPAMTWSGRGRQPGWIKEALAAGKSLEDVAIK